MSALRKARLSLGIAIISLLGAAVVVVQTRTDARLRSIPDAQVIPLQWRYVIAGLTVLAVVLLISSAVLFIKGVRVRRLASATDDPAASELSGEAIVASGGEPLPSEAARAALIPEEERSDLDARVTVLLADRSVTSADDPAPLDPSGEVIVAADDGALSSEVIVVVDDEHADDGAATAADAASQSDEPTTALGAPESTQVADTAPTEPESQSDPDELLTPDHILAIAAAAPTGPRRRAGRGEWTPYELTDSIIDPGSPESSLVSPGRAAAASTVPVPSRPQLREEDYEQHSTRSWPDKQLREHNTLVIGLAGLAAVVIVRSLLPRRRH